MSEMQYFFDLYYDVNLTSIKTLKAWLSLLSLYVVGICKTDISIEFEAFFPLICKLNFSLMLLDKYEFYIKN